MKLAAPIAFVTALLIALAFAFLGDDAPPPAPPRVPGDRPSQMQGDGDRAAADTATATGALPARAEVDEAPLAPDEPPHFALEGIVLEKRADGSLVPVPGRPLEVGPGSPPNTGASDAEGRFRIELSGRGVGPAFVMLKAPSVEGSPLLQTQQRVRFPDGKSHVRDLRVILQPAPAFVGEVVDPAGEPLQGVRVELRGRAATTDRAGRFDLGEVERHFYEHPMTIPNSIVAALEGAVTLAVDVPGFSDDALWQPARIVMARAGALEVELRRADGTPLGAEVVQVSIAGDEPLGKAEAMPSDFKPPRFHVETDEAGVARIEGVPAGLYLRVFALGRSFGEHDGAGRLAAHGAGGIPIAVEPARTLRLSAVRSTPFVVRGVVLEPDGGPSPQAIVNVQEPDSDRWDSGRTDAEGRFEIALAGARAPEALVVRAESTLGEEPSYSPFGGRKRSDPLRLGRAEIEVAQEAHAAEVEIALLAHGKITGKVIDSDGEPAKNASVVLVPEEGQRSLRLSSGEMAHVHAPGGEFQFVGVPPGLYRIEARHRDLGSAVTGPITHDARDVTLKLDGSDGARVRVVIEGLPDDAKVLLAFGSATVADESALTALNAGSRFAGHGGFPEAGLRLYSGVSSQSTATERTVISVEPIEGKREHTLRFPVGAARIGVRAIGASGAYAPVGTGLVRVRGGETEIVFAPSPTGTVRLSLADHRGGEHVEVRDLAGRALPWIVSGPEFRTMERIPSSGTIEIANLPAGAAELLIGTQAELEAGRPRLRERIDLAPWETLEVAR